MKASVVRRHPVASYFVMTFLLSWMGAFCLAAPYLFHHQPIPQMTGILMFPAMLAGPVVSSMALTGILDGRAGLRDLFSRMGRVRVGGIPTSRNGGETWGIPSAAMGGRWYAVALIFPAVIFAVLLGMRAVSPVYSPGFFVMGILFGIPAGFFEEIGWMGFAYPRMSHSRSGISAALLLGVLWALWHLPVIDFLGAASPHGKYVLAYFCAFACAMTAVRVVICWVYTNTRSVVLCQLLHASSTGSLVIFSPHVNAAQEVMWYLAYAAALWTMIAAVAIVARNTTRISRLKERVRITTER